MTNETKRPDIVTKQTQKGEQLDFDIQIDPNRFTPGTRLVTLTVRDKRFQSVSPIFRIREGNTRALSILMKFPRTKGGYFEARAVVSEELLRKAWIDISLVTHEGVTSTFCVDLSTYMDKIATKDG